MRMKKVLTSALAAALAVSAIPGSALAAEWNNDGGSSTATYDPVFRQPVLEVALPGELAFQVDPLKLNNKTQILGGEYNIINYSDTDVRVKVQPAVITKETLDVTTTSPDVENLGTDSAPDWQYKALPASGTNTKKSVYVAAVVADTASALTEVAEGAGAYKFSYKTDVKDISVAYTYTDGERSAVTYTKEATDETNALEKGTYRLTAEAAEGARSAGAKSFEVLLKPATYDTNEKLNNPKSVTSFTVVGAVDSHKTYEDGEIQLSAIYKMDVQTKAQVEALESAPAGSTGVSTTKQQLLVTQQ